MMPKEASRHLEEGKEIRFARTGVPDERVIKLRKNTERKKKEEE